MNRIVLIGNGFDLAHGLKTSYKDFINDYWEGFMNHCIYQDVVYISGRYKFDCIELVMPQERLTLSCFLPDAENPLKPPYKDSISYNKLKEIVDDYNKQEINKNHKIHFKISNEFLLHLIKTCNKNMNWVDIENEYYKFLIYQFDKRKNSSYYYGSIKTLNEDFKYIKAKLDEYLYKAIKNKEIKISKELSDIFYSAFLLKEFTESGKNEIANYEYKKIEIYKDNSTDPYINDMSDKTIPWLKKDFEFDIEYLKQELLDEKTSIDFFDLIPKNLLFLNFNYTTVEKHYQTQKKYYNNTETTHIHGELNSPDNPIIFGYGDELEENYSKLENLQDNAYLENIKSIQYQETDNYKKMLNFINSDQYQVIILGHSCGNSDRTLLNTLFEHENCVSIKPYYYQYKDEKTGETKDNYSDIVRNISRSFKDKKSMRDKVVNKTYTTWFSSDGKE